MSWLSNFTSAENAAALLKQAVSHVESKIDQVLDIPPAPHPSNIEQSAKSVARAPTAFRSLRGLSSSLSAGLQNVASGSVTPSAPSDPDDSRASVSSQLTEVPATTDEIPSENVATVSDPSAGVEFNDPQTSSRESAETTTPNNSKGTTRPLQISNAVDLGNLQKHIDESDGALGTEQAIEETGEREDLPVVALQDAHQNLVGPEIIECSEPTMAPPNINPASSIAEEIPGSASNANAPLMEPGVTATQQISTDSAGVKAIIEQREQQLMKTMQENASLTDTVTSLKNQLEELEALRSKEKADAASKARGLSDRLAAVEQQLKVVSRERDELRSSVDTTKASLLEVSHRLEQREEVITQLMTEGEKLSKVELKLNTTIKRLRAEKSELENQTKQISGKLEQATGEISTLKSKLNDNAENDKKQNEAMRSLKESHERHTREVTRLQAELASSREQQSNAQSALERAHAELQDLRAAKSEATDIARSEALEKQIGENNELKRQLENLRRENETMQSGLSKEVQDLRDVITQKDEEAWRKEDALHREIVSLQEKLQAAEGRNAELSTIEQESTRPLLQQLEMVQSQYNAALRKWEHIERNLTSRLLEAESSQSQAISKENELSQRVAELNMAIASVNAEVHSEREQRQQIQEQLERKTRNFEDLSRRLHETSARCASLEEHNQRLSQDLTMQEVKFKRHLEQERQKWKDSRPVIQDDAAKKPPTLQIDTRQMSRSSLPGSGSSTPRRTSASSIALETRTAEGSVGASLSTAAIIERLHTTVKHYEGQVGSLQLQLQMAEQGRNELADELVRLTTDNDAINKQLSDFRAMKEEKDALNQRYLAALELLGERTEKVEELEADIKDMKHIFHTQVTELVQKLDELRKGKSNA